MDRINYVAACNTAVDYIKVLTDDPMSEGAPIDEITQDWLRKHAKKCSFCMEASVDGSMP